MMLLTKVRRNGTVDLLIVMDEVSIERRTPASLGLWGWGGGGSCDFKRLPPIGGSFDFHTGKTVVIVIGRRCVHLPFGNWLAAIGAVIVLARFADM